MRRSRYTGPISVVLFAFILFFIAYYLKVAETVSAVYGGAGIGLDGVLAISLFFILESAVLYFMVMDGGHSIGNAILCTSLFLIISFLSYFTVLFNLIGAPTVFLLAPLYWYGRKGRTARSTVKFLLIKGKNLGDNIVLGVATFFLIAGITLAIILTLNLFGMADQENVKEKIIALPDYVFPVAVLLSPFAEELFFRGFLRKKTGPLLSSFVFAMFHFGYGSSVEVIIAFFIGAILCSVTAWRKNLVPAIVAHGLFNLSTLTMMRFFA